MLVRSGFVSNSSTSSYFILAPINLVRTVEEELDDREKYFMLNSWSTDYVKFLGTQCWYLFGKFGNDQGHTIDWSEFTDGFIDERRVIEKIIDALQAADKKSQVLCITEED